MRNPTKRLRKTYDFARRAGLLSVFLLGAPLLIATGQSAPAQSADGDTAGNERPTTQPQTATAPAEGEALAFPEGFSSAAIVPIHDQITDISYDSFMRRLEFVQEENVPLVIVELNTPGGVLGSTLEICREMLAMRDRGIRVYAWVNPEAFSAGTIIALAADGIIMSSNGTMGNCQPIMITGGGASAIPEGIEAKATSVLIEELRNMAKRNSYDMDMVFALIRPEMQIFWVENTKTGEREFVDRFGRDKLFGWTGKKSSSLIGLFGGSEQDEERAAEREPLPDSESKTAWRYVDQDELLGKVEQPIVSHRVLLTMKDYRARAFGFSRATITGESELRDYFQIQGAITRLESNWIEAAIEWLASPTVRGVLFLLMLLGAYAEFQAPGLGVPGIVAVLAMVLFLGAPYLAGFAVTWEIVVIVLGLVFLALEIFVIPGFGIAGFLGIVFLGIGMVATFVPAEPGDIGPFFEWPSLPATFQYMQHGVWAMGAGMVGAIIGMILLAYYLPKAPGSNRLIVANPTADDIVTEEPWQDVAQVGDKGVVESLLRPAGRARFDTQLVDVVSQGEYIQKGSHVEVIERHGNRIVVRKVDGGEDEAAQA